MMNKFKNHCKNPITWGAYYKLCGISLLASVAISAAMLLGNKIYEHYQLNKFDFDDVFEEEES